MAYFRYHETTGELFQISDYELSPNDGESVSQIGLPKIALETEYEWVVADKMFVFKTNNGKLTKLEFLRKFTAQERIAIRAAAQTDPIIFDAMELLNLAEFVSLSDTDTINLVGYLAMVGIIATNRVSEILS